MTQAKQLLKDSLYDEGSALNSSREGFWEEQRGRWPGPAPRTCGGLRDVTVSDQGSVRDSGDRPQSCLSAYRHFQRPDVSLGLKNI